MKATAREIISRGLSDASEELLRSETIKKGYIKELARLSVKDERELLRELFAAEGCSAELSSELKASVRLVGDGENGGILARLLTETYEALCGAVDDDAIFPDPSSADSSASFVSGSGADSAFDEFSRRFHLSAVHTSRISYSFDAVLDGDAGFCIIPVVSSNDGRLRSFYKMIDVYGMKIAAVVSVESSENIMRYALCKRDSRPIVSAPSHMEFSVPCSGSEAMAIARAAHALGNSLIDISSLPSERNGEIFSFTFKLGGAYKPFLLYLNLFHPSFTLIGIYDII